MGRDKFRCINWRKCPNFACGAYYPHKKNEYCDHGRLFCGAMEEFVSCYNVTDEGPKEEVDPVEEKPLPPRGPESGDHITKYLDETLLWVGEQLAEMQQLRAQVEKFAEEAKEAMEHIAEFMAEQQPKLKSLDEDIIRRSKEMDDVFIDVPELRPQDLLIAEQRSKDLVAKIDKATLPIEKSKVDKELLTALSLKLDVELGRLDSFVEALYVNKKYEENVKGKTE